MSIWCSWEHIGTDSTPWEDVEGRPLPIVAEQGQVLSYANGWSNHYPNLTGEAERPARISIAHTPAWCVPGYRDETDECGAVGSWLRLDVDAPESLNFWFKDAQGTPAVGEQSVSVVMDVEAVRSLRDDLTAWLDREHLEAS